MAVGIFGLPQAGKTTIFNAATRGAAGRPVRAGPNLGVVKVPDARLGEHAGLTLGTDWAYRQVRLFIQAPLEAVFTTAQRATDAVAARVSTLANRPPEAWGGLLGRPPLGVALAAVLLTFAVVVVIAVVRAG